MQCCTYKSFLGKVYLFVLPHDTYRRKGEEKLWWQSAPLSGTCCNRRPRHVPGTVFSCSLPTAVLPPAHPDTQAQKATNLRPDSLSFSPLGIVTCQSRASLHRNKCGNSVGLTGVTLQANKERLSHWNWTLIHTWTVSRSGLVWLRINLFITKMNLPLLWGGITTSFQVYHNKMMLFISACVLPVLCLVLRTNKCHWAALELLDVIHLT